MSNRRATVYTTLDPELEQAAQEAVRDGMELVDRKLRSRAGREDIPRGQPQVALVALDPHTGAIKALVGGRNYRRQPVESRAGFAPAGFGLQTVRIRRRHRYRGGRRNPVFTPSP